jgi:subtilisin family serine protease
MNKVRLQVIVPALNKRHRLPPPQGDPDGIIGVVLEGFSFIGEEVGPEEMRNRSNGKWYKDRDGYFYWGGGLIEIESIPIVRIAPIKAGPPSILPGWINSLGIDQIWNTTQGEGVKIAILDSGYNVNILDLSEAVIDSKVFFTSVAGNPVTINDTFGHGSHCASLIGGRNKITFTSCAPKAHLFIAKICSEGSVRSFSIMVDAIKWAIQKQVDIISISYGGETSDAELEAIIKTAVHDHNILVVASIGDKFEGSANFPCFPALYNDCLAVGATNDQGQIADVTVIDDKTEINAPGKDIFGYTKSMTPEKMSGTSQASAIVAGICALMISQHKKKGKTYTVSQIRNLLVQHSNIIPSTNQKIIAPLKIFKAI